MNPYLEKAAAILQAPHEAKTVGSRVRNLKSLSSGKFGFKASAKTPLLDRIK